MTWYLCPFIYWPLTTSLISVFAYFLYMPVYISYKCIYTFFIYVPLYSPHKATKISSFRNDLHPNFPCCSLFLEYLSLYFCLANSCLSFKIQLKPQLFKKKTFAPCSPGRVAFLLCTLSVSCALLHYSTCHVKLQLLVTSSVYPICL